MTTNQDKVMNNGRTEQNTFKTSHAHVRHKCFTMCMFKSINQSNDTM